MNDTATQIWGGYGFAMGRTATQPSWPTAPAFKPSVWTGSADQRYVRGEWDKYWRLPADERSRYQVRRYSACGMIVPVLRGGEQ